MQSRLATRVLLAGVVSTGLVLSTNVGATSGQDLTEGRDGSSLGASARLLSTDDLQPTETAYALRRFEHVVSIEDALEINDSLNLNAVAIRFENAIATGEYSLLSGWSVSEFATWFGDLYGTEAEAVGLVVPVPGVLAQTDDVAARHSPRSGFR